MKRIVIVCLFLFISSISQAQMPSIDDFMSPAENEPEKGRVAPTEIKEPEAVKVTQEVKTEDGEKTPVVAAANAQDAINKAVEVQREFNEDIVQIQVGSGIGIVARGEAIYEQYPNRNATLLSQRQAYVKAFMYAKKNLAEYLYGLTVDAQQQLVDAMDQVDTDKESLANAKTVTVENNRQKLEGLLKGYAIYKVNDDQEKKLVTVSIVTTPKTRGETMQVNGGTVIAKDSSLAMKQVLAKLKTGVLPPLGGNVISVPTKNQIFFIGFGSEIVRFNENDTIMRKNKQFAINAATMRAKAALAALIIGDQASWTGDLSQTSDENLKQFEEINKEDPMNQKGSVDFKGIEETRSSYITRTKNTDTYRFAQQGQLPAGLNARTWVDGDWAYALYVYNPEATKQADQIRSKMQAPGILDKGNKMSGSEGQNSPSDSSGSGSSAESDNRRDVQKGASGQVSDDDDL